MALDPTTSRSAGSAGVTELAYAQVTADVTLSATTEATANTIVTAGAVVLDGATTIVVEFFSLALVKSSTANDNANIVLYDAVDGGAAASIGKLANIFSSAASANTAPCFASRRLTPAAGSHVYSIRGFVGTNAGRIDAGAGGVGAEMPAYIRVVEVPA